jgi:hypothetical protein
MEMKVIEIQPEIALLWLQKLHPRQRVSRSPKVAAFSRDMDSGRWRVSPQPIVITKSGFVADGVHRLLAVVMHGKPVKMMVCFGAEDDIYEVLDQGTPRSHADVIRQMGVDVHSQALPVVKFMAFDGNKDTITSGEVKNLLDQFSGALGFLAPWIEKRGRGTGSSIFLAAAGQCWLYESNKSRISTYLTMMTQGTIPGDTSYGIALANFRDRLVRRGEFTKPGIGPSERKKHYWMCQRAVQVFVQKIDVRCIAAPKSAPYPKMRVAS